MSEGMTCYERDEALCDDQMCLRVGCLLRNKRLVVKALEEINGRAVCAMIATPNECFKLLQECAEISDAALAAYRKEP